MRKHFLRSFLFNIFYIGGVTFWSLFLVWTLPLPRKMCTSCVAHTFGRYMSFIEKYIMGITLEFRGLENLPKDGNYILAAKHQSAFETLKFPFIKRLGYPVIILKRELSRIPVFGWYFPSMGQVPIDRSSGKQAMEKMAQGCRRAMDDGRPVIIFPQGTRVAVGAKREYKVGLAKLYKDLKVPVVPVALNSGVFWGRNTFMRKPGVIVFEFLAPIPVGTPPLQMMERLEKATEAATDKLVAEAQEKYA